MSIVKGKNWWCIYFLGATGYPILRQGLPSGYLLHSCGSHGPTNIDDLWSRLPLCLPFTSKKHGDFPVCKASQALAKHFYVASLSWFQSLSQRWLWLKSGFRILHTQTYTHTSHIIYIYTVYTSIYIYIIIMRMNIKLTYPDKDMFDINSPC